MYTTILSIMIDIIYITADGIALGAAIMLNRSSLTLIVFVAIMLHKVGFM